MKKFRETMSTARPVARTTSNFLYGPDRDILIKHFDNINNLFVDRAISTAFQTQNDARFSSYFFAVIFDDFAFSQSNLATC